MIENGTFPLKEGAGQCGRSQTAEYQPGLFVVSPTQHLMNGSKASFTNVGARRPCLGGSSRFPARVPALPFRLSPRRRSRASEAPWPRPEGRRVEVANLAASGLLSPTQEAMLAWPEASAEWWHAEPSPLVLRQHGYIDALFVDEAAKTGLAAYLVAIDLQRPPASLNKWLEVDC